MQSGSSRCARARAVGRVEAPAALFPAGTQKSSRETAQTGRGWAVEGVWGVKSKSTGRQRWCTLAAAFLECCSPGAACLSLSRAMGSSLEDEINVRNPAIKCRSTLLSS